MQADIQDKLNAETPGGLGDIAAILKKGDADEADR